MPAGRRRGDHRRLGQPGRRDQLTRQAGQLPRGYAGQLGRRPFLLTPLSRTAPGPAGLSLTAARAGALSIAVRDSGGQLVMRTGLGGAVSGLVVLAAGGLAAWMIGAMLWPLTWLGHRTALADLLTQLERPGDAAAGPGPPGDLAGRAGLASRRVTERQRQAIVDTSRELCTLVSVLAGLTEYYRLPGPAWPGRFRPAAGPGRGGDRSDRRAHPHPGAHRPGRARAPGHRESVGRSA